MIRNNQIMHEKKCHTIFNNIQNGEILYVKIEEPFFLETKKLYSDEVDNTKYMRVSILTDAIIDYDLKMFKSERETDFLENYRPYFISFVVSLGKNKLDDLRVIGDSWCSAKFITGDKPIMDESVTIKGYLEMSASPISYLNGRLLVFKDKSIDASILKGINETYTLPNFQCMNDADINRVLNEAWKDDFPVTIDIYNVGHGNADYIRGEKHRILYDIGYNYRSMPSYHNAKYLRAVNAIRHLKPSCVILSHWDLDHIIGCAYAEKDIFTKKWIAPNLTSNLDKNVSKNSIRLAAYLQILDKLCLVDRDIQRKKPLIAKISCENNIHMNLWLGNGMDGRISRKNREGLMIEIIDKKGLNPHVLLPGDVPYNCMPNLLLKKTIDFMHVPHHCSKMNLAKLNNSSNKGKCAIISTNRKVDRTLNCDSSHFDGLTKKFKEVISTMNNGCRDDEANLSIQIKYRYKDFSVR